MSSVNDIPIGWEENNLGEVCEITSAKRIFAKEYKTFGIPFFRGKEVTEKFKGNEISTELFITKEKYEEIREKYGVPVYNDILLTSVGTLGNPYLVEKDFEFYFKDGNLTWFKNFNEINSKFLFYWIVSPQGKENLSHARIGSTQQAYTMTALKKVVIIKPTLPEQKAIANILTAFDDKIENLQDQNKTLEQTAQTIFKEWFGKYKIDDALPDGWRVGNLEVVTKVVGGTTPSTKNEDFWNGNIFWSSPKDLSNNEYIYLLSTEKKITESGLKKISSGLLPKNTLLLSSRAPVGYLALTNIELAINQGYIAILPSQYFSNYYTFLWLKKNMKKVISAANGSTFLEISKSAFRNIDCVIPKKSKIEDFDKIVAPFFKKTLSNQMQIQTLKKTRDTLLPKLMNGQIRVKM